MAHNHLEQMIAEWYEYQGYFVRRNVFVGVAASIFFFFVYFVLQQLGFVFGEAGRVPAWLGAWLPNLFFGVSGLLMMARVR